MRPFPVLTGPPVPWAGRSRGVVVNFHEGGSGSPLVLLNGWTASGLVWPRSLVDELQQSHRVIRIDNRGTGWSRHTPMSFVMSDLADDVAAVLRSLHLKRATVVGLSMGGMIAQEFAARHPNLTDRLILLATRPPTPEHIPSDPNVTHAALRPRRDGESLAEFLRSVWASQLGPGSALRHEAILNEIVQQSLKRPTPRTGIVLQSRAVAGWASRGLWRRIGAPTTIVHGTHDPIIPVGNAHRLARSIRGSRYVEVDGVGHLLAFEAPDVVLDMIRAPEVETA